MKWAGHVLRMNDEEPTKKLMLGKPDGTRRRGRPELQWIDGLEKDLHNISIETGKISPLIVPDGGVVLSRPRPTLGCITHVDDDDDDDTAMDQFFACCGTTATKFANSKQITKATRITALELGKR
jgi:hypothetical protein